MKPIPVICKLSKEAAPELAEIDAVSNTPPWNTALFESEFDNQHAVVLGARLNGQLIGFVVLHQVADEAHIVNFAVRPAERGQGVGRSILKSVIDKLFSEAVSRLTLEVRRSNQVAQALYRQFGFVECGVRPKYYADNKEDALLMGVQVISK